MNIKNKDELLFSSEIKSELDEEYTSISLYKDEYNEYSLVSKKFNKNNDRIEQQIILFDQNVADSLQQSLTFSFMNESQKKDYTQFCKDLNYEPNH